MQIRRLASALNRVRALPSSVLRVASLAIVVGAVALASGCGQHDPSSAAPSDGIHAIKHIVVIMQENRSFDSYFGTYPGADGFPMKNGR